MKTFFKKNNRLRKAFRVAYKRRRIQKRVASHLRERHGQNTRFRLMGFSAIAFSFVVIAVLFSKIFLGGYTILWRAEIHVPIYFDPALVDPSYKNDVELLRSADFHRMVLEGMKHAFPEVTERGDLFLLRGLLGRDAPNYLRKMVMEDPSLIGTHQSIWLPASSVVDMYLKGKIRKDLPPEARALKQKQEEWIALLKERDALRSAFNIPFFTQGDSREPEEAGFLGAMVGSFWVVISCLLLALPIGVMTALYLEEMSPKNRFTDWIEININNLAAVPSIVFGLLGLSVYIHLVGLPRSSAIAGGFTLGLLVLPTIVISTRTSLRMIPRTLREAALAVGARPMQVVLHHLLPLAMPGIMTGTILSIARAVGETAPLLMIGMVAFVVDIPSSAFSASTAMPVQIFLWADSAEAGFAERTSAGILVLLIFLALANFTAVLLRRKYERRW